MAKGKIEIGDEVMVPATVIRILKDGHITLQIGSAGQRITLPKDSDIKPVNNAQPQPKKRKGERLLLTSRRLSV